MLACTAVSGISPPFVTRVNCGSEMRVKNDVSLGGVGLGNLTRQRQKSSCGSVGGRKGEVGEIEIGKDSERKWAIEMF